MQFLGKGNRWRQIFLLGQINCQRQGVKGRTERNLLKKIAPAWAICGDLCDLWVQFMGDLWVSICG
jgi:hypothetical protein